MRQKIRKAVFPVAGFGTRFLPATKAMPKELLPVIDKPLIQYAAEEAVAAGIDTLIFVTGRNKRAIEDHFDSNPELEGALRKKGKNAAADLVRNILPTNVECIFVRQAEQLGLGHAVACAARVVGDEPFAVLLADDFIPCKGPGVTAELVAAYEKTGNTQLSVMAVDPVDVPKYGIIEPDVTPGKIRGLIEKPSPENAPSLLASIGRYVLTPDIFDILRHQECGVGGEIQLAEAIDKQAAAGKVSSVMLKDPRFDCGSVTGYLDAILHVAKQRD
jgi:UTP--glucose-1-phosphate uridylyltransferase